MRLLLALSPLVVSAPAAAQGGCWRDGVPCPEGRFEAPAIAVDGELLLFGGLGKWFQALTRVDAFDPQQGVWTARAPLPAATTHAGVARDGRTVWFAGGFDGNHPGVATDAVWTYDVDLDAWSAGPALPRPVAGGALVVLGRGLHWFGGLEADRDTNVADHWVLDLDDPAASWAPRAPLPEPRCHLAGVALNGRAHAVGGAFRHDTNPADVAFHHAYDPLADAWTELAALPQGRSHFENAACVAGGRIVVAGGRANGQALIAMPDATAYDPGRDRWSAVPQLPAARQGASAARLGSRWWVVGGSLADFKPLDTTWFLPLDELAADHLRLNAGGQHYVSPVDGASWCAGHGFLEGEAFENAAVPDVDGTDEDELLRSYRTGSAATPWELRYRLAVDDGKWRARLRFAEILHGATGYGGPAAGQRVLSVQLEGQTLVEGLDVGAEVGAEAAYERVLDFESQGAAVDLSVLASQGDAMLGALELVRLRDDSWALFCDATPNSTGSPAEVAFVGSGSVGANDLTLTAAPVPADFGLFFYGAAGAQVPLGNGWRCVAPPFFRLPAVAAAGGELTWTVDLADPPTPAGQVLAGSTWVFQAWFRDLAAGGAGSNTSGALRLTFTD